MDPMILILVIAVGAMFLMSRSSRKKQQAALAFRDNLKPGDSVMTASGYLGTVVAVADDEITLESTPGNTSRWLRAAIAKQVDATDTTTAVEDDAAAPVTVDVENKRAFDVPDDISGLIEKPKRDDSAS